MAGYRFCLPLRLARTANPLAAVVVLDDCYPRHCAYHAQCFSYVPHTSSSSPMLELYGENECLHPIDTRHILASSICESHV